MSLKRLTWMLLSTSFSLIAARNVSCASCKPVKDNFALGILCDVMCSLLKPSSSEDAPKTSQGLKVIGAGLGRTGTASLQEALGILGFKSYHMSAVVLNMARDLEKWHVALQNDTVEDVVSILTENGYDASADEPVNYFTLGLIKAFPDAKVVLTTRTDAEKWTSSVRQIGLLMDAADRLPWRWLFGDFTTFGRDFNRRRGYELDDTFDKEAAMRYYHDWNSRIRESVPSHRLLDFQVQQGWEPLCGFLGIPVPPVPFPRANDKAGLSAAIAVLTVTHYLFMASPICVLLCMRCCCRNVLAAKSKHE
eukprot:TRINITY_DN48083_c0_g1_i1.p1 TRINITY_DN48083_c0_g1~~TRINITY_DN48083_c0_g1_i1.p1  ORF type:complete len:307 (-),score=26.93 TRINITY_DN48083_c0_g1_i1:98-1018(-)